MAKRKIDHQSRSHALLSASGAELWLNCPGSAIAAEQYPDEQTVFTQEGTIAHEVAQVYAESLLAREGFPGLDAGLQELRDKWGEAVTGEMLECAEGYAAYIQEHMTPTSTVLLEQRLDFSPWVPEGFGTGDCIIIDAGRLTVIDYKYGQGVTVETRGNPQMRLYALGAINDYGCVYDFSEVVMSIYQPRINNISEFAEPVDALLDWAETVVQPTAKEAFTSAARFIPGPHCRKFCKHAGRCPALTKYCSDFVETHGLRAAVPHLMDGEYLEIVRMEPLIRMWLDRTMRTATDRILAGDKIEGLKVVEGRSLRKWSDEDKVENVLLHSPTIADDDAIYEPATLKTVAAMERAIGKKKVAGLLGDLIVKAPGKPTLALAADKRQDYNPGADFEDLDAGGGQP